MGTLTLRYSRMELEGILTLQLSTMFYDVTFSPMDAC